MGNLFGEARQNGYVVEDLDSAAAIWVDKLGAGPFFALRHIPFEYFTYRGRPTEPDLSVAIGYMGDFEIELIHQHNDAVTPYLDFASAKGSGLHHVSAWSTNYDEDLENLRKAGHVPECEGKIAGMSRFAYWHTSATDGTVYELSDLGTNNEFGAARDLIRQASMNWDGSKPLREFG